MPVLFAFYLIFILCAPAFAAAGQEGELPCNDLCRWWLVLGAPAQPGLRRGSGDPVPSRIARHIRRTAERENSLRPPRSVFVRPKSSTAARGRTRWAILISQAPPLPPSRPVTAVVPEAVTAAGGFPSGIPEHRQVAISESEPAVLQHSAPVSGESDWERAALRIFEQSSDVVPAPFKERSRDRRMRRAVP